MKKGFTYIELLIALALFSIALFPLLPLLTQAYRNENYAQETYAAQLHAQGIMSAAREAAVSGADIEERVVGYASALESPPFAYGVWCGEFVYESGSEEFDIMPDVILNGLSGEIITVLCKDANGNIYGRAVGFVPNHTIDESLSNSEEEPGE